ncbi:hypothetical protein LZ24_03429 [Desulfobotulus alkaliphilus]|uniref:Uncharacterized protein n=1 Tax=Desulfobotulus alkaliphilus TaxID=622671 RepID=A0A562QYF5_9BACT|nr:hypothetical protein [Desulfobotulus alkaliphilus]TWI61613.1 hypothetical protein LZ24_03429 [Desulfobotulus alkaliphilus]
MVRTYRQDPVASQWLQIGNQALGLGAQMNQIRGQQEDRKYRQDLDRGLGAIEMYNTEGPQQGPLQRPEDISPSAWHGAQDLYGRQEDRARQKEQHQWQQQEAELKKKVQEYLPNIHRQVMSAGGNVDKVLNAPLTGGIAEYKARTQFVKEYAQTAQAQKQIMESRLPVLNQHYQNFRRGQAELQQRQAAGDTEGLVRGLQGLVESMPFPFRLGEYDGKSQSFEVQFLDMEAGDWKPTQKVPLNQIVQEIQNMGDREFFNAGNMHMEAVRQTNIEQQPVYVTSKDGKRLQALPQMHPYDPSAVHYLVFGEDGKMQTFKSRQELFRAGFQMENLQREALLGKQGGGGDGLGVKDIATFRRNAYNDALKWADNLPKDPITGNFIDPATNKIITPADLDKITNQRAEFLFQQYMAMGNLPGRGLGGGGNDPGIPDPDDEDWIAKLGEDAGLNEKEKRRAEREAAAAAKRAEEEAVAEKKKSRLAAMDQGIKERKKPDGVDWQEFIPYILNKMGTPPEWIPTAEWQKFQASRKREHQPAPIVEWFKKKNWNPEHGLAGPRPR